MSLPKVYRMDVPGLEAPQLPADWRVLITGVTSIHGWPVYEQLKRSHPPENLRAVRPPKMEIPEGDNVQALCIADVQGLEAIREQFHPTHVIYGSGVCDLDVCEERPDWAREINVGGPKAVAEVFGDSAYILFMGTDLVFSGNHPPAGGYDESHAPDPVSVAGRTFLEGESLIRETPRHAVLRLGLPIGDSVTGTKGAVDFIDHRFRRNLKLTLFHDEWRSCIACDQITAVTLTLLRHEAQGLFHCGGDRPDSLHDLGRQVIRRGDYPESLLMSLSRHEEVNGPPRIGNVALNSGKLKGWLKNLKMENGA